MVSEQKEEYYEHINYRELLKLQPDNFYLHLPIQVPFTKWFFEGRLQLLLMFGLRPNYFGMRHNLDLQSQWFSDWVFLNHYQFDYQSGKKWKPSITDRVRYQWLMRQGYAREQKEYLELSARDKERKVTVQERKFLKKYEECRYWSYFDYARDEELAFFRMGVDADEPLQNEDKPLFPNLCYSYPDDPRLAYWQNKVMLTEHIPATNSWFTKRKARRNIMKKWNKGHRVSYADIRVMFNPDTTKIHDLEFLFHCFDKHNAQPEYLEEKKLYDLLYPLYTTEITHIAQMMHYPELEKLNIAQPKKDLNPLYIAYKQRWFGKNQVKDFAKVFHGVTKDEYQDIVNQQYASHENKRPSKNKVDSKKSQEEANSIIDKLSKK